MNNLENLRHSCAHLLAAAVKEIWPDAKRTIGPSIENGFYFDFDFGDTEINEKDFARIEQKMREVLKTWNGFERIEVNKEEAEKEYKDNEYKLELINEFADKGENLTFYKSGNYQDLCRGGHVENPKETLKNFKLLSVAGAYWRGDEKNKMLTRIYGTAFFTKEELEQHLIMLEEAKKRDHRKLGPQLDLFMFHETAAGMPYWLPKGVLVYNQLIEFWRKEHVQRGYQEIISPLVNRKDLYVTSGHFDHYWEDMFHFQTKDKQEFALKAMNCPNAMIVFGSKKRSYKELPLRLSDTDTLHRNELSGTLNGLLRVQEFRQDDAHCFISEEMIRDEYARIFEITEKFYSIFGLNYFFRLSTRPDDYMGDLETWNKAEKELEELLKLSGKEYFIGEKEGAFYGPKIDIMMKDCLGRTWQMGTIQLDFQQPRNFELKYTDKDGSEKTPVAIHRVIYGSIERFLGILIEHLAGAFPVWLAPVQVAVFPISDRHHEYAKKIVEELKKQNIRVQMDDENKTIGNKIRHSTLQKVPYMIIMGDKEIEKSLVSVRTRDGKDLGQQDIYEFIKQIQDKIEKYE